MCLQDKSCSLGPQAVFSLLPDDADVLLVGHFSGLTLSHTAALIAQKDLPYGAQPPTVYACVSGHTEAQRAELQQTMTAMGCKSRRGGRGCLHDNRGSVSSLSSLSNCISQM